MRTLPTTERERTESAIRKVFEEGCAAWNRGDLDGYLASYWDSEPISCARLETGMAIPYSLSGYALSWSSLCSRPENMAFLLSPGIHLPETRIGQTVRLLMSSNCNFFLLEILL